MSELVFIIILLCSGVWVAAIYARQRKKHAQSRSELTEIIRQRPAQSEAAINRLLDTITPPIADPDEVIRRGQALAKLLFASNSVPQKAGVQSNPFSLDSQAAVTDTALRLRDARACIDAALELDHLNEAPDSLLYIAQITRLALEESFQQVFVKPDAYSGALWAKAVTTGDRAEYFLVCLMIIDASNSLAKSFSSLINILSATGYRLPVSAEEHKSYAQLKTD